MRRIATNDFTKSGVALPYLWAALLTLLVGGPWLVPGYLFGTDWPAEPMESTLDELPKSKLSPADMQALNRGNAERLFPRFKS